MTGRLVILSGPSGSGKSTVVSRALAPGDLRVYLAVSATTRTPRPGEQDGRNYYFWTADRFEQGIERGEFLEWAEVHGNRYGTLKSEVESPLRRGECVLLEIDVQGARQVRRLYPEARTVFLRTSSMEEYEKRLRARRTETEEVLQRRLAGARRELAAAPEYEQVILNDHLDDAVAALRRVLRECGG